MYHIHQVFKISHNQLMEQIEQQTSDVLIIAKLNHIHQYITQPATDEYYSRRNAGQLRVVRTDDKQQNINLKITRRLIPFFRGWRNSLLAFIGQCAVFARAIATRCRR